MMSVVGNEIADKSDDIGTKAFDPAITFNGAADDDAKRLPALFHGMEGLYLSHTGAIERRRDFAVFVGRFQPHDANIVHVRDDGGNRPPLTAGRIGLPRSRRKIMDQILVDAIVGVKRMQ